MEQGHISNACKYDYTAPKFQTAYAFLKRDDLAELPVGWIELENGVRASIQHYTSVPEETKNFETHEKYFDVQFIVRGTERIGMVSREGLVEKTPYEPQNDITFYERPALYGSVILRGGDYVTIAPEDAHMPGCAAGECMPIIKVVVKVPV